MILCRLCQFLSAPQVFPNSLLNSLPCLNRSILICKPDCPVLDICDRTTSRRGSSTRISASDSWRSENTINTHKHTIAYYTFNYKLLQLSFTFKVLQKVEAQKMLQKISQSLQKPFLSHSEQSIFPRRECHLSAL
jgi:hypothetical protein